MTGRSLPLFVVLATALGLLACSGGKEQPGSSGAPAATGAAVASGATGATGAAVASGATGATPTGAGAAGPAKFSGKTVHMKRAQGACTFEWDSPEELKETAKDGMSFTLENDRFLFIGYEGTTLHMKPEHALDMFKGEYKDLYRGEENGVQVAVVTSVKDDKPATEKRAINGMGGEPYSSDRILGCTFACEGVKDRASDVVAMCRSVRITVKSETKH